MLVRSVASSADLPVDHPLVVAELVGLAGLEHDGLMRMRNGTIGRILLAGALVADIAGAEAGVLRPAPEPIERLEQLGAGKRE